MKELIPEFFYLPEMFRNENRLPLGRSQDGLEVNDVELPPGLMAVRMSSFAYIERLSRVNMSVCTSTTGLTSSSDISSAERRQQPLTTSSSTSPMREWTSRPSTPP